MFFVLGMVKSGVEEIVENESVGIVSNVDDNLEISPIKPRALSYGFADSNIPPVGQRIKYNGIKWVQVPQGYKVIKLGPGGKPRKDSVKGPGIRFVPSFGGWLGSLVYVNLRRDYIDVPKQRVGTNDPFEIGVDAVVHFQVEDPVKAILEETDYKKRLEQLTMQTIRGQIGNMDIFGVLASKGRNIDYDSTEFERMGVKVYSMGIKDVDIPNELEEKISAVGRAKLEKQAMILIAEGEVEAAKKLKEIAAIYGDAPVIAYMRYLEGMVEISKNGKSSFIFVPAMYDLKNFTEFLTKFKG